MNISMSWLGIVALSASAAAQSAIGVIDPPNVAAPIALGSQVALVGDLDADGVGDFIVAAPGEANATGAVKAGVVRIYSGKTRACIQSLPGSVANGQFGFGAAGAGDFDLDGVPDLVIGTPFANVGGAGTGGVSLFSFKLQTFFSQVATATTSSLGFAVAGAGDLNGDGFPDVIVGAPSGSGIGPNGGAVVAISGKTKLVLWTMFGSAGDQLGWSVSGVGGDTNADGFGDVIAGAPTHDQSLTTDAGMAQIRSGVNGSLIRSFFGTLVGQNLGQSVAGLGDASGDGQADVAIGAPGTVVNGFANGGSVTTFTGSNGGQLGTSGLGVAGARFGSAVSRLADVSGDGRPEVLVGTPGGAAVAAPYDTGAAFVMRGADLLLLKSIFGTNVGSGFGAAVAGGLDASGDAFPDFLVGAPGTDTHGTDAGEAVLFSGAPPIGAELFRIAPQSSEFFGKAVALPGDLDGDGTPDVLVGSPDEVVGGLHVGAVRLYSGKTGAILRVFAAATTDGQYGASVTGVGDENADGVPDVLIGAPLSANAALAKAGKAVLYSGKNGAVIRTHLGAAAGNNLGASVAGVGDVNADGKPDYAVGIPAESAAVAKLGQAVVFSGATGLAIWTFNGASAGDLLGASVSGAGDANLDGRPDVIVGAPRDDVGGVDAGAAKVFSGKAGTLLFSKTSTGAGDRLGSSVAGAGDMNGDGFADVIAGAPLRNDGATDNGAVFGWSGMTNAQIFYAKGDANLHHLGAAVAGLGDIDLDGRGDFAAGAPDALPVGMARIFTGASGSPLYTLAPSVGSPSAFGAALAGASDLNADGFTDLVIGAPLASPEGGGSGEVTAVSLVPLGIAFYGTGTPGCSGSQTTTGNTAPTVGNAAFALRCNHAPPSALGLNLVGDVPNVLGSDPLGLGVLLHVDLFLSTTTFGLNMNSDAAGFASSPTPVPPTPGLAGVTLYGQSLWFWPAGPCSLPPFQLSTSRAVAITIQ
ncbi:MAG TPA: integrin alpha [Planctomycetota bacterium]|nr:integrin alpha [Planctomycetota bacterium]